jgi:TonB family protein
MFRRLWPAILVLAIHAVSLAASTSMPSLQSATLEQRERHLSAALIRASQFSNVPHISSRPACEDVQAPVAIATPDPLFAAGAFSAETRGRRVKVSFIIGTDGRVHSPLILESAGLVGDRHVLQTVRTWRYHPATCNGVPTETEGKIEFSGR